MRSFLLTVIVGASLAACSSDSKGTADNPLATVSGFCQAWAEVACNPDVVDYCNAANVDDCQQSQADYCEQLIPSRGYDPTNASECLRAVENAYEDGNLNAEELLVVRALGGDCSQLIRGSAEQGDDCTADSDCDTTAGFACVKRSSTHGTCQVPVEVDAGRSCDNAADVCIDGFYCDGKHCVERLSEGNSCDDDSECAADLRCQANSLGEGGSGNSSNGDSTCVPRAPNSSACESHEDCASGFCFMQDSSSGECISLVRLGRNEPICDDLR